MAVPTKAKGDSYSEQIRASQYDPAVDADLYNFQREQQQQSKLQKIASTTPRGSLDISSLAVNNSLDHYPSSSSFSDNSNASTFINLTPSNSSLNASAEGFYIPPPPPSSSSSVSARGNGHRSTPPSSEIVIYTSATPPLPPSAFNKTNAASANSGSTTGASLSKISASILGRLPGHMKHSKSTSVASANSGLVSRGSRSSLQLNLRTHHQQQNPTLVPTPSHSPGGTWDGPNLAPSPLYPSMDPAFLKEQQLQQQMQLQGDGVLGDGIDILGIRLGLGTNRQDDARLQLEQEREYLKSRKWRSWTRSKILLLLSNTVLLVYSVICTVVMSMSWTGAEWTKPVLNSGIMMIANQNVLYLMMVTAPCGIAVALLGFYGILKQSRKVLSLYAVLLWPLFGLLTSIGYICYRRRNVALYQKLKFSWINEYTRDDRLVIQNALSCCGYRSMADYPSYDLHCFPRAPLPACESLFLQYQQNLLSNTSSAAFSLLPLQLLIMIVALLCSNHIDHLYRSANPITPKLYTQ
ncbi:hypothetical protein BGZ70_003813 [Mortierella alpina]|uniref:Tetraspanin Tsp2 n=1 Tax=Mortierella alpina TaxID=64518 RepID=A0A9P6JAK3_MORAP|nr:hypothetical protein BGZ70_003813 [Mortierella alpina]